MSREIQVAAVQMDAAPAPTDLRLVRAERLVAQAAAAGAQLVVLPEVFNTGYGYTDANHRLAEPLDGPTATWMKNTAARLNIHLAGSLMLLEGDEVYNALLLFAPDGRMWRYDKNYPWGWERGYFRERQGTAIAHTDLGDLGLLICWDVAHPNLWKAYAGRVDMMVVASCPPDISNPVFQFADGRQVTLDQVGPLAAPLQGTGHLVFDEMIRQQAAWLGVPTVATVGCGHVQTPIPNGRLTLLGFALAAPWLARHLPQADRMQLSCGLVEGCQILDAQGQRLAGLTQAQGEAWTIAGVTWSAHKPSPREPQPASPMPWMAYLISDWVLPWLSVPVYRRGLRRVWGRHMAPIRPETRKRVAVLGLIGLLTLLALILARNWRKGER